MGKRAGLEHSWGGGKSEFVARMLYWRSSRRSSDVYVWIEELLFLSRHEAMGDLRLFNLQNNGMEWV